MDHQTIVLLKTHEDAGRKCQPGEELTLPAAQAEWLVGVGVARPKSTTAAPAAAGKRG